MQDNVNGLIARRALAVATESLADFRVLVIHGARQVGKTTSALALADVHSASYVTLDDIAEQAAAAAAPRTFLAVHGSPLVMAVAALPGELSGGADDFIDQVFGASEELLRSGVDGELSGNHRVRVRTLPDSQGRQSHKIGASSGGSLAKAASEVATKLKNDFSANVTNLSPLTVSPAINPVPQSNIAREEAQRASAGTTTRTSPVRREP